MKIYSLYKHHHASFNASIIFDPRFRSIPWLWLAQALVAWGQLVQIALLDLSLKHDSYDSILANVDHRQASISQLDTHIYQICSKHPDGGKPSSRVFLSINALRLDRPCVLVNFGASWHQRQAGVRWLT